MLVRRSNLCVAWHDAAGIEGALHAEADAITLDLRSSAGGLDARAIRNAASRCEAGSAEVFVRVSAEDVRAQLAASASSSLNGIMLSAVSAADVRHADEAASQAEIDGGFKPGAWSFIVRLESAAAVWEVRAILAASRRISQVGLDETALARSLGIETDPAIDPFVYARGRLAVEATAAKVPAVGMAYPLSVAPRELPPREIQALATTAKNLGMKGVICPFASWVQPVNAAFTPSAELVAYNRRVREAFAAGVAAGTAAVPLDGRMIDVPVDEWAKVVLETAEACAMRDAQKRAARQGMQVKAKHEFLD